MEAVSQADEKVFLWINHWVGAFPLFDRAIEVMVSDYLVPVVLSLVLLGLWFGWRGQAMRERHQRGVMLAAIGVGIASAMVMTTNLFFFRLRPFVTHDVELLFYAPTDSSFPANPVAVTFAMATGVLVANRKIATVMYLIASLYGFSRVYAGVFYPLDVVGGALIGIGATCLVHLVLKRIEPIPTLCLKLVRLLLLA